MRAQSATASICTMVKCILHFIVHHFSTSEKAREKWGNATEFVCVCALERERDAQRAREGETHKKWETCTSEAHTNRECVCHKIASRIRRAGFE
mmetsp:Transcript_6800/g.25394  ORF Transcript_6800/g.25394 Transcript_6800/m.25394 type:complete len:94 (-) Transcript_6800:6530-6811(-)